MLFRWKLGALCKWSISRPGVAMTMSGPRRSAASCAFTLRPPVMNIVGKFTQLRFSLQLNLNGMQANRYWKCNMHLFRYILISTETMKLIFQIIAIVFKTFKVLQTITSHWPADSETSILVNCVSCLATVCICTASSRVGVRTRTRVTGACLGLYSNLSSTGSRKAAVLPGDVVGMGT